MLSWRPYVGLNSNSKNKRGIFMKKKRVIAAIMYTIIMSLSLVSCGQFQYGADKFYLEMIASGGMNTTWYYFRKQIDSDIILEPKSNNEKDGYELSGDNFVGLGHFDNIHIENKDSAPYISAAFCCYYNGVGDSPINIYFNYTVKSTGERKEETWKLDFKQEPFEDKRQ